MSSTSVRLCCCWRRNIYKPLTAGSEQNTTNLLDRVINVDDPWLVEEMLQDLTKTQTNWEKALISTLNIKTLSYEELNDLFQYATRKIEKNKQQFDQYKATNERLLGTKNAADSVLSDANANETVKAAFQQLKQSFSDIDKQIEDNKNKMEELVNQLKSQMSAAEAIKKQIDAHSSEGTGD